MSNHERIILPDASVTNRSGMEIINLLDTHPDRQSRFSTLSLLYARRLDISKILAETYGYSPEKFAGILSGSVSGLLAKLPNDYLLLPVFYENPYADMRRITMELGILTPQSEQVYYAHGDKTQSYDELVRRVSRQEPFPGAGYVVFSLYREKRGETTFDIIYGDHLNLRSKMNTDQPEKVPTPLRMSEGSPISISDEIVMVQEVLIWTISSEFNTVGIVYSTGLTKDGKKTLLRNGYSPDYRGQIPVQYQSAFAETTANKTLHAEPGVLKVVHLPGGSS